jgi:hypothetical protein
MRRTGALCMEEKRGSWVMGTSASLLLLLVGLVLLFFLPMAFCVWIVLLVGCGWLVIEEQVEDTKSVWACVCVLCVMVFGCFGLCDCVYVCV